MSLDPRFHFGIRAMQAGDWSTAISQFRGLVAARSSDVEALFYLGVALLSSGQAGEAVAPLERLARKDGDNPAVLNALGSALAATGERTKAAQRFRRALSRAPGMVEAAENLGRVLLDDNQPAEALPVLDTLVKREPGRLAARLLLGRALESTGDMDGAERAYRTILEHQPGLPAAVNALGLMYYACGLGEKSLACFEEILARFPDDPVAGCNRALALGALGRSREAEEQCRMVLAKMPDLAQANLNLGKLLSRLDQATDGIPFLDRVDSFEARWFSALTLPLMYEDEDSVALWRQRYVSRLEQLGREFATIPPAHLAGQVGVLEKANFFLPYQAENDREPQAILGRMQAAIAQARHGAHVAATARGKGERIKVGFISAFLFNHTIAKLFTGWMVGLDRADFEVFVFYAGSIRHPETVTIENGVEHFVQLPPNVTMAVQSISSSGLDALIHLDVGMSSITHTLAALRLAPVQCVAVGHPETTGLPTMDYFLSGELIEPGDGEAHYTETLVRLPGVGFNFVRPPLESAILPAPRPPEAGPVYFCAQSLWKILPRHDALFARIAEQAGSCSIWFCALADAFAEPFRKRMDKAFAARGLAAGDYVTVHPKMHQYNFLGLMKSADVSLDSLEWSGGNTTMEALACGTPVVTVPGRFMRGRVTAGILTKAGLAEDLVAADEDSYVAKAVALGRDKALRARVSAALLAGAPAVLDDTTCVAGLADFLKSVVRR